MGRTSRSRRPCARGEVLCTEPGKSHPCPDRQAGPGHEGNSRTMNMHADENSDGVIVPEKRPNKEGLPSAEAVEGRTPPKGNGGETAAARTLRRDTASRGNPRPYRDCLPSSLLFVFIPARRTKCANNGQQIR